MRRDETNLVAGDRQALRIEKWVYGGRGLGRAGGLAVLVPYVLPGEEVRARITRTKPGLAEAELDEVLTGAADRQNPPCPYFGRCGGCHYQHSVYAAQLAGKRDVLVETLRRVGRVEAPGEIEAVSAAPWEYRNRTQFHLSGGEIGFHAPGSHRLCPVDRCPISSPPVNAALTALREMMRDRRFPRFLRSIELFTNGEEVLLNARESVQPLARRFFEWCAERIPGAAAGCLDYMARGRSFRVSHNSFFQVNRFLVDELAAAAVEGAGESALDLYAGVGLFSLELADHYRSVVAVESGASAARDLEFNTQRAAAAVTVLKDTAESYLGRLGAAPDLVLADPPRAGLGGSAVKSLIRLRPRRLTIVACDPATLARDLGALTRNGYRLERLTLVDLFPQTYHMETIAHLVSA